MVDGQVSIIYSTYREEKPSHVPYGGLNEVCFRLQPVPLFSYCGAVLPTCEAQLWLPCALQADCLNGWITEWLDWTALDTATCTDHQRLTAASQCHTGTKRVLWCLTKPGNDERRVHFAINCAKTDSNYFTYSLVVVRPFLSLDLSHHRSAPADLIFIVAYTTQSGQNRTARNVSIVCDLVWSALVIWSPFRSRDERCEKERERSSDRNDLYPNCTFAFCLMAFYALLCAGGKIVTITHRKWHNFTSKDMLCIINVSLA